MAQNAASTKRRSASRALARLAAALDRFARDWLPRQQPGSQLATELPELRRSIDRLELLFSDGAAALTEAGDAQLQGSTSPAGWLSRHCRMSAYAAAQRLRVGHQLSRLPASARALAEGEIGFAHLVLIADTARAVATSPTGGGVLDEAALLAAAREIRVSDFRHHCHHVRHAADPEGCAAAEEKARQAGRLELRSDGDGTVRIKGRLEASDGATLKTALEPLARRRGGDDGRTHDRRLADAMAELAWLQLERGHVRRHGGQRAHLQVTTTLETLLGQAGAPAAELEFGLPISSRMLERLACDCTLTRVLLGSDSAVVDVGRARRVVSRGMRRALNRRDKQCQWPGGCGRPAACCSAHNLATRTRNGEVTLDSRVLLCHHHHRLVHEGGWQLLKTDDGRYLTIPPPPFSAVSDRTSRVAPAA